MCQQRRVPVIHRSTLMMKEPTRTRKAPYRSLQVPRSGSHLIRDKHTSSQVQPSRPPTNRIELVTRMTVLKNTRPQIRPQWLHQAGYLD